MTTLESLGNVGHSHTRGLPDDVYDVLLDALASGELESHTALSIDRLAKVLQVSPTPVREALARLEHTGLVERAPRRGYRVARHMSRSSIIELADARLVMEVGAIERAMAEPEELCAALEVAHQRHAEIALELTASEGSLDHERVKEYFVQDWAFHEAILDRCGNQYLKKAVNNLSFSVHRIRQTLGLGKTDAAVAVLEHERILEAVRLGDVQAAKDAMTEHLTQVSIRSTGIEVE